MMDQTVEESVTTGLLLLFFTHFYVPILEPVQTSLFAASSDDQTATGQLIAGAVWLVAGTLMLRQVQHLFAWVRSLGWTMLLAGLALLSALWSQDASVTMRKAIFLLLTTMFGVYFARRYPVERQLRIICTATAVITVLSILFALFLPRYGLDHDVHEGVWVGVFTQKNVCARELLFLLACLLCYQPVERRMRWCRRGALAACLAVIMGTQSKTAWMTTAILFCFVFALKWVRKMSRDLTIVVGAALLGILGCGSVIAMSAAPRLAAMLGRDSTMTGRTEIWHAVLQAIFKHPLLGYGFAAFWLSLRGESANIILALRWAVPAAHNGLLEIWLQLGMVGLLLFGAGYVQACGRAIRQVRQRSFERAVWPLTILLLTLIYNIDESSLMQANDFLWVLYVATVVNLAGMSGLVQVPAWPVATEGKVHCDLKQIA